MTRSSLDGPIEPLEKNMRIESSLLRLGLGAACLLLLACGDSPSDPTPDGGQQPSPDGGIVQPPDAGPPTPTVSVSFLEPTAATVHTKAPVRFRVQVSGSAARSVALLQGEQLLAELATPYEYTWDIASLAEGSYPVTARATAEDGSGTAVSPVRTVIVDRTPPAVLTQVPAAGEDNIFIEDPITLTFSEPLLPSTVNSTSVRLSDGSFSGYDKNVLLAADGKTLTVNPRTSLSGAEQFQVFLRGEVTDLAGNAIDDPFYASERWLLPPWHAPAALNRGTTNSTTSRNQALVVPPRGPPTVAWVQEGRLCAARWDGRAWQPLGPAATAPCGTVTEQYVNSLTLALDASGRPVVSWRSSYGVEASRWDGSAWQQLGNGIPVSAIATALRPAMVLDAAGNPVLAWDASNGSTIDLYVARWNGSAWERLGDALSATGGQFTWTDEPSLAVDGQGRPVVAWQELSSGGVRQVHVRRWTGSTWEALGGAVSVGSGGVQSPSLKVDAQNRPVVAWSETVSGGSSIYVRRWSGSSWVAVGGALNVAPAGGTPSATRPSLALEPNGNPSVAWEEADAAGVHHVHVRRWDGTTWKVLGDALGAGASTSDVLFPALAVDEVGRPSVAWGQGPSVLVRRSNRM